MMTKSLRIALVFWLAVLCTACGFHLQGEKQLAPPLHRMYLQTNDPYGPLARSLQQYMKMSHVRLVDSQAEADTVLVISGENTSQDLLGVSGTQQTRQYNLKISITMEITDRSGRTIINPETLSESRAITVQSNQILGSSNEVNLYYQQMRRALAYAIMNRIASREVTYTVMKRFNSHET